MPRSARALLLDLDDTLYPLRRFRLSGFAAVARHLARFHGVDEGEAFRALVSALRGPTRGHEMGTVITRLGLRMPETELVRVYRSHEPVLRLPEATDRTLRRLRRTWKLAIVTNGIPAIQAAKIRALGLEHRVDTIVYASEWGAGEGKPERAPFVEALRRLGVQASRAIALGDDEFADVFGAARVGVHTIQTREWRRDQPGPVAMCADAVIDHISEVPTVADCLMPRELDLYAA